MGGCRPFVNDPGYRRDQPDDWLLARMVMFAGHEYAHKIQQMHPGYEGGITP